MRRMLAGRKLGRCAAQFAGEAMLDRMMLPIAMGAAMTLCGAGACAESDLPPSHDLWQTPSRTDFRSQSTLDSNRPGVQLA